ncbi:MAG: hypothetical protein Q9169_007232, partial [Polycauliona sp. 2 TL-2023]
SYTVRENASSNCKIWEAARATTAAPTFFKRITIADSDGGKEDFLDGGVRWNNPTPLVLDEAISIFGDHPRLGSMIGKLKQIATDCELTTHNMEKRFIHFPDSFFRYSVTHGIGGISLEEWKKMKEVRTNTKAYLNEVATSGSINKAVAILCRQSKGLQPGPALQSICMVGPQSSTEAKPVASARSRPQSSALFTGREGFLDALQNFFTYQGPGQHPRREFLLWGMGGAGKTQIALRFAELHRQRYNHILRVDASSRDTLEQSYKTAALELNIASDGNISLTEALHKLKIYQGRWLLLFDGADSLDEISDLFPPGVHGDILYTSRNQLLRRLSTSQTRHVADMATHEAGKLLLRSARLTASSQEDQKHVSAIIAELGYLALAIDQAGAYIASGECSLNDFTTVFNSHRQHLMKNEAYKGASEGDRAVYTTWDLSYTAIERQAKAAGNDELRQGPAAALSIMRVVPYFHKEDIMEDIFRLTAQNLEKMWMKSKGGSEANYSSRSSLFSSCRDGKWESLNFRKGLQVLRTFSLVGQGASPRRFSVHHLVHLWAYDRLAVDEKRSSCMRARVMLQTSLPRGYTASDLSLRRELLPHVMACQRRSSPTENYIFFVPQVFEDAGRWKEAEEQILRDIKWLKTEFTDEFPATLIRMCDLATISIKQGRLKEGEEMESRLIVAKKKVFGEEHPETLRSIANLACSYSDQGRLKEAEELESQLLSIKTRVLGDEHMETLIGMASLARTYMRQRRLKEAEDLGIRVLETRKRTLGEEHPFTLESMNNLATTYMAQ